MHLLIAFVYLLIAYGSLFPFNFSISELTLQYSNLLSITISGWGDVIANIGLFMPLGLLYSLTSREEAKSSKSNIYKLGMWSKIFVFALVLQVFQIALPERDQNIFDVFFNLLGFSAAYILAQYVHIPRKHYAPKLSYLPIAIALIYILSELSPFVPTLDFHEIKNSVKPLLILPTKSIISEMFFVLTMWLLVIRLISFNQSKTPLKSLVVLWLIMIVAKVFIYSNYLSYIDIIAPILALLFVFFLNLNSEKISRVLLYFSLLIFTLYSFSDIGTISISYTSFIPFYSYLTGNLFAAIQGCFFKLFFFGAILWLALELSISIKKTAINLCLLVLSIELLQIFMPTRVTDFADVLLVLFAYLLVRNLGDYLVEQEEQNSFNQNNESETVCIKQGRICLRVKFLLYCMIAFCVFYVLVNVLLSIPGVPYNVIELFNNKGGGLFFFFVFLHALGGASYYVSRNFQYYSIYEGVKFLGLHFATLGVLFLLLWFAVSIESIEDIVGASKLRQAIYENQTSQSFLMVIIKVISLSVVANFAQFFDFSLRFSALFGLVQVPLTFWLMCLNSTVRGRGLVLITVLSLLLLFICFHTVFIFAITDNITELIAKPFLLLLSLVALTFSIALTVQLITKQKYLLSIILIVLTATLSWPLTLFVFEQSIVKYGFTFSALDFLIGAGREHIIDSMALMRRWILLIIAFQGLMIFGCLFYKKWQPNNLNKEKLIILIKVLLISIMLVVLGWLGNRLFGKSMHWQTIYQVYFNPTNSTFEEDKSEVDSTNMLKAGDTYLNDKLMQDLATAMSQAKAYDTIRLTQGYFKQAGILTASHVRIIAEPGAVVFGKTTTGKGALLIKGDDTYVKGLECHSIYVPDNNGVCIRLEGKGITLNNVYFHHAQGGLLGSRKGGDIRIENSRFEHLGNGAFYHGIYTLEETRLFINNSYFLNNRNGGHEIKSRSFHTEITNSVIASSQSRDSRLIDVPNGGGLIVRNNILVEGPFSENHDLLSWGVEGIKHQEERVIIEGNTIISDKNRANLISMKRSPAILSILDNVVIGDVDGLPKEGNLFFDNRAELSIPAAPFIPEN